VFPAQNSMPREGCELSVRGS